MDVYGHVNNARFLTLYEEARVAMLFGELPSLKDGVVISRHEIDYLRPVDYSDPVRIESWVEEIRPSRFTIAYELFDADLLASRARTVELACDCGPRKLRSSRCAVELACDCGPRKLRSSRCAVELACDCGPRKLRSSRCAVCVPFDLAAGRPRRLSDAEAEFLRPWVASP
jgi:acyl-CoA thioester hydrolase